MKRQPVSLSVESELALKQHAWPGNVRELDNVMQRALILQTGSLILPSDLHMISGAISMSQVAQEEQGDESDKVLQDEAGKLGSDLRQHEFQLIIEALKATHGSRKEAAERLAISPRTLRYKLARIRDAGIDLDSLLRS